MADRGADGGTDAEADLLLRADRAWVDGKFRPAAVEVRDGMITAVLDPTVDDLPAALEVVEVPEGQILLPGLVDTHVHINDPGRTDWEAFPNATAAAAAAGITTLVDMPLNSIPVTTTVEALEEKREAARGRIRVDLGFWGGAVPDSLGRLGELHDAGVVGFKCFLSPSGIEEFPPLDADQLRAALTEIGGLGSLLIVHAEDPKYLAAHGALGPHYADFLASRPPKSEESAIVSVIDAVRETGGRAHIVHLSDAGALPALRAARAEGLPITVETCPHYLTLRAEEVPDGATEFKCCPPIRGAHNQDLLWDALLDGTIELVVSDHSPSTLALKRDHHGDFGLSWGGIAGLQLGFAAVVTEAERRGVPLEAVLPLFTTGPAGLVGFSDRGRIAVGQVAHLTVFDPAAEQVVHAAELEHLNPITAYEGRTLRGRMTATWLGGDRLDLRRPSTGRTLVHA